MAITWVGALTVPRLFPFDWRAWQAWLLAFVRMPESSPEHVAMVRTQQFRLVAAQLPLVAISTCTLVAVILFTFWQICDQTFVAGLTFAMLVINLGNLLIWRYGRQLSRYTRLPKWVAWGFAIDIGILSVLDVILAVHIFGIGNADQRALSIGIAAAVMATGGWVFSPLLHTGLIWSALICGFGMIYMGLHHFAQYPEIVLLIGFYGVVLTGTVLVNSKTVMENISNALSLEKQNQVVGLLLNDFEENTSDWLWEIDRRGRLLHAPLRLANSLGMSTRDLLGKPFLLLLEQMAPKNKADQQRHAEFSEALQAGQPLRDKVIPVTVDGQVRWWSMTAKPLIHPKKGVVGWRGVGSDVTVLHERDDELNRLANVDSLTGLANRYRLHQALAENFPAPDVVKPCTLFLIDLDNFKHVNDLRGHITGDILLTEIGRRLTTLTTPSMLLARLGGDEFALMVPTEMTQTDARSLADTIQATISVPCDIDGQIVEIFASMGVAHAPVDASNASDLLKACDLALYAAKGAGKHTLRFYDPQMDAAVRHRLTLLAELKEALTQEQFILHFQPQIDLTTNTLVGFEALVRWQHPQQGLVPPLSFIPAAEDSGLIVPLGQWVLKQACLEAAKWPSGMRVAVNISAVEFERSDLLESVELALANSALPPQCLELELTESVLMQDSEATLSLLNGLRQAGVRLSLDDFGTGFSSLSYLHRFPLDQLKIDRSFVMPLGAGKDQTSALAVVKAIHGLAQALDLEVLAEGVETVEQLELLSKLGCVLAQGYRFSRPLTADQTGEFIATCQTSGLAIACEAAEQKNGARVLSQATGNAMMAG
jgi:diguanylate cyclase (GGDEF)-like protein/PAS domain S-box-containing protein